jgi:hypothetical protein
MPGSPAASAGICKGDILWAANGARYSNQYMATNDMATKHPGTIIRFIVKRGGEPQVINLTVGHQPKNTPPAPTQVQPPAPAPAELMSRVVPSDTQMSAESQLAQIGEISQTVVNGLSPACLAHHLQLLNPELSAVDVMRAAAELQRTSAAAPVAPAAPVASEVGAEASLAASRGHQPAVGAVHDDPSAFVAPVVDAGAVLQEDDKQRLAPQPKHDGASVASSVTEVDPPISEETLEKKFHVDLWCAWYDGLGIPVSQRLKDEAEKDKDGMITVAELRRCLWNNNTGPNFKPPSVSCMSDWTWEFLLERRKLNQIHDIEEWLEQIQRQRPTFAAKITRAAEMYQTANNKRNLALFLARGNDGQEEEEEANEAKQDGAAPAGQPSAPDAQNNAGNTTDSDDDEDGPRKQAQAARKKKEEAEVAAAAHKQLRQPEDVKPKKWHTRHFIAWCYGYGTSKPTRHFARYVHLVTTGKSYDTMNKAGSAAGTLTYKPEFIGTRMAEFLLERYKDCNHEPGTWKQFSLPPSHNHKDGRRNQRIQQDCATQAVKHFGQVSHLKTQTTNFNTVVTAYCDNDRNMSIGVKAAIKRAAKAVVDHEQKLRAPPPPAVASSSTAARDDGDFGQTDDDKSVSSIKSDAPLQAFVDKQAKQPSQKKKKKHDTSNRKNETYSTSIRESALRCLKAVGVKRGYWTDVERQLNTMTPAKLIHAIREMDELYRLMQSAPGMDGEDCSSRIVALEWKDACNEYDLAVLGLLAPSAITDLNQRKEIVKKAKLEPGTGLYTVCRWEDPDEDASSSSAENPNQGRFQGGVYAVHEPSMAYLYRMFREVNGATWGRWLTPGAWKDALRNVVRATDQTTRWSAKVLIWYLYTQAQDKQRERWDEEDEKRRQEARANNPNQHPDEDAIAYNENKFYDHIAPAFEACQKNKLENGHWLGDEKALAEMIRLDEPQDGESQADHESYRYGSE